MNHTDPFVVPGINGKPIAVVRLDEVAGATAWEGVLTINLRAGGATVVHFSSPAHASQALEDLTGALVQQDRSNETDHDNQRAVLMSEAARIGGGIVGDIDVPGFFKLSFNGTVKGKPTPLEWEGAYEEMLWILKGVGSGTGNPGIEAAVDGYERDQQA